MILTTSWDDGHPLDWRAAELLARYELPGTFYVPLKNPERPLLPLAEVRRLAEAGFESGGHTWNHTRLPGLDNAGLQREVAGARLALQDALGRPVVAFCYPGGKHNRRVRMAVREAGYFGARGIARYRVQSARDPFHWGTATQAHAFTRPQIAGHLLRRWHPAGLRWWLGTGLEGDWVQLALALLAWAERVDGVWHLWGHSWEIEAQGQWPALERVLQAAAARPARRLTNGELFGTLNVVRAA